MGTNGRTVDRGLTWRSSGIGKSHEDVAPNALFRLLNEAVVERFSRSIFSWRVNPMATGFEDANNSRDHLAIIHSWDAARLVGQKRFQAGELVFRQPKQVIGHDRLLSDAMSHCLQQGPTTGIGPNLPVDGVGRNGSFNPGSGLE
jgi:hypothetical protein